MAMVRGQHVAWYLGLTRDSEQQLAEALTAVASRHDRDPEIRDIGRTLARWSWAHMEALETQMKRYGEHAVPDPERLRGALFHGNRIGGMGLLRDLQDLLVLANRVHGCWTSIVQAANALQDKELEDFADTCCNDTFRQVAWLKTQIRHVSPQALAVPAGLQSELAASVPRTLTAPAVPAALWAPLAGGTLTIALGAISLVAGQPWLVPSLGPTVYLQAESPANPAARPYNVVVGHLIGLLAGFAAVALLGAWDAPVVLQAKQLVPERAFAAVIAIVLTLGIAPLVRASHPPAAATALLVALGSLKTPNDAINVMIGAIILALLGEGLRRLRLMRPLSPEAVADEEGTHAPGMHIPAGGH